ncbi:MAG: YbaK/EbsC family protein [Elusimicrobia bacterium]|nr:YbaK/EbsC family protein [Elusimicrobiota bacterium]
MPAVNWLQEMLDRSGTAYEWLHHMPAMTAGEFAAKEVAPACRVAKAVVVFADRRPVLLVLGANRRVNFHVARLLLGARELRKASEEEMRTLFPDCEVGAEPPVAHWPGVELWMDPSLQTEGDVLFPAGTHQDGVRMPFWNWFNLAKPNVGEFAQERAWH